jgi:hypothetical protein
LGRLLHVAARRCGGAAAAGKGKVTPLEWGGATSREIPVPISCDTWYQRRFAKTDCGVYVLAAFRIGEPWANRFVEAFAAEVVGGALSADKRGGFTVGEKLTKLLKLGGGTGSRMVESAIVDIRHHEIARQYREAVAAGGDSQQTVARLATANDCSSRQIYKIINNDE